MLSDLCIVGLPLTKCFLDPGFGLFEGYQALSFDATWTAPVPRRGRVFAAGTYSHVALLKAPSSHGMSPACLLV